MNAITHLRNHAYAQCGLFDGFYKIVNPAADAAIPAPWIFGAHNDFSREITERLYPHGRIIVYACPLCGWYRCHPLYCCGHCRGKLERLAVDRDRWDEWSNGRLTDGM